jgi:hypothetical protein
MVHEIITSLDALSARDRRILALAMQKAGRGAQFADLARALRDATAEVIPAGRVFYLGRTADSPILGSLISGVGIVETPRGVEVIRIR